MRLECGSSAAPVRLKCGATSPNGTFNLAYTALSWVL